MNINRRSLLGTVAATTALPTAASTASADDSGGISVTTQLPKEHFGDKLTPRLAWFMTRASEVLREHRGRSFTSLDVLCRVDLEQCDHLSTTDYGDSIPRYLMLEALSRLRDSSVVSSFEYDKRVRYYWAGRSRGAAG